MKNNLMKHIVVLASLLWWVPTFAQSEEFASSSQDEWQVTTLGSNGYGFRLVLQSLNE
jgi:hypothetical protein